MTLTTSKGKSFPAHWAWAPVNDEGDLMIEYDDARKISEIAADWEGCARITRESAEEGDAVYEGYTEIRIMSRQKNGTVRITLKKEG